MKTFTVKRYVIEKFCVEANNRKEAAEAMAKDEHGGPYDVIFLKQTYCKD